MKNVIKYNIAKEENELNISIVCLGNDKLIVGNNLQIIENTDSTYTDLLNLSKRFDLLKKNRFTHGEREYTNYRI